MDSDGTQSQRRVTFHLPDGSQESCSDSGLGDQEPACSGNLLSHPLPLVQPQDEFYEQASPDKRTEADGNSDPNSELLAACKHEPVQQSPISDHLTIGRMRPGVFTYYRSRSSLLPIVA
ncbi:hypothetical protein SKAU_G00252380 [Synaphobranchus kaupii]|uniref:Uncharacterized protein n=1 Tax=Synaphobranchus kaupii TaxID=118154 RepID=A0A9Q1IRR0_SYNKA|nr:hypothetical protein SKAU_G00252380 [Synaphobranchus kaupii]